MEDNDQEDDYQFTEVDFGSRRPSCAACGDPVKIVTHSGGRVMAAQHCNECYAELRYGKVPKIHSRRML